MLHSLKTDSKPFQAVLDGDKTFEVRKNDRNFSVGDELCLRETLHSAYDMHTLGYPLEYTGREIYAEVTYILCAAYGIPEDVVIMAINVLA